MTFDGGYVVVAFVSMSLRFGSLLKPTFLWEKWSTIRTTARKPVYFSSANVINFINQ